MLKRVNSKIKEKRRYSLNDDLLKFMEENKKDRGINREKKERHDTVTPFQSRSKQIIETHLSHYFFKYSPTLKRQNR